MTFNVETFKFGFFFGGWRERMNERTKEGKEGKERKRKHTQTKYIMLYISSLLFFQLLFCC